jgi:hypothetical protein
MELSEAAGGATLDGGETVSFAVAIGRGGEVVEGEGIAGGEVRGEEIREGAYGNARGRGGGWRSGRPWELPEWRRTSTNVSSPKKIEWRTARCVASS